LQLIRSGLFLALMFTTMMEFQDQQLHALADFAVYAILFAIVGGRGPNRVRRGRNSTGLVLAAH